MALKIDQTWAQIGLKTGSPQLRLQIREPQLKVRQDLPRVQIRQQDAKVKCDSSQSRAEIGLRKPLDFSRYLAQKSFQESSAYIGQVARTGDIMASFDKYDISAVMAYLGAQAFEEQEFNVARVPKSPVKIEVIPGDLRMNWQLGKVQLEPQFGDVSTNLVRGEVDIYLRQKASIDIQYMGEKVDTYS